MDDIRLSIAAPALLAALEQALRELPPGQPVMHQRACPCTRCVGHRVVRFARGSDAEAQPEALALPSLHSNGTGASTLVVDLTSAAEKVGEAVLAVMQTAPHLRDYYTQPPAVYEVARRRHRDRVDALAHVKAGLEQLALAIHKIR